MATMTAIRVAHTNPSFFTMIIILHLVLYSSKYNREELCKKSQIQIFNYNST